MQTVQISLFHPCDCTGIGSARATYADRKAELSSAAQFAYDPISPFNPAHVISYVSPRTVRRPLMRGGHVSGESITKHHFTSKKVLYFYQTNIWVGLPVSYFIIYFLLLLSSEYCTQS